MGGKFSKNEIRQQVLAEQSNSANNNNSNINNNNHINNKNSDILIKNNVENIIIENSDNKHVHVKNNNNNSRFTKTLKNRITKKLLKKTRDQHTSPINNSNNDDDDDYGNNNEEFIGSSSTLSTPTSFTSFYDKNNCNSGVDEEESEEKEEVEVSETIRINECETSNSSSLVILNKENQIINEIGEQVSLIESDSSNNNKESNSDTPSSLSSSTDDINSNSSDSSSCCETDNNNSHLIIENQQNKTINHHHHHHNKSQYENDLDLYNNNESYDNDENQFYIKKESNAYSTCKDESVDHHYQLLRKDYKITIVRMSDIPDLISRVTSSDRDLLSMSQLDCIKALSYYKWNSHRMLQKFIEYGDEEFKLQVGIIGSPSSNHNSNSSSNNNNNNNLVELIKSSLISYLKVLNIYDEDVKEIDSTSIPLTINSDKNKLYELSYKLKKRKRREKEREMNDQMMMIPNETLANLIREYNSPRTLNEKIKDRFKMRTSSDREIELNRQIQIQLEIIERQQQQQLQQQPTPNGINQRFRFERSSTTNSILSGASNSGGTSELWDSQLKEMVNSILDVFPDLDEDELTYKVKKYLKNDMFMEPEKIIKDIINGTLFVPSKSEILKIQSGEYDIGYEDNSFSFRESEEDLDDEDELIRLNNTNNTNNNVDNHIDFIQEEQQQQQQQQQQLYNNIDNPNRFIRRNFRLRNSSRDDLHSTTIIRSNSSYAEFNRSNNNLLNMTTTNNNNSPLAVTPSIRSMSTNQIITNNHYHHHGDLSDNIIDESSNLPTTATSNHFNRKIRQIRYDESNPPPSPRPVRRLPYMKQLLRDSRDDLMYPIPNNLNSTSTTTTTTTSTALIGTTNTNIVTSPLNLLNTSSATTVSPLVLSNPLTKYERSTSNFNILERSSSSALLRSSTSIFKYKTTPSQDDINNDFIHNNDEDNQQLNYEDLNIQTITCKVCLSDYRLNQMYAMECNHQYCKQCWRSYLESKINSEGISCLSTKCMDPFCKLTVGIPTFKIILNRKDYDRFCWFFTKDFIDNFSKVTWCTNPNIKCNNIIYYDNIDTPTILNVKCNCDWKFCFHCGKETHLPATCKQIEDWKLLKSKDEGLNYSWISQNTKKCPNCKIDIEKNNGCMHMICINCKFGFCWLCKGSWKDHGDRTGGFFSCNKFVIRESLNTEKVPYSTYIHYFQRYIHHHNTRKIAQFKIKQLQSLMETIVNTYRNGDNIELDLSFLKEGMDLILECRQVLKYSYVYGYFLSEEKEKKLFEFLQEDVEKSCEHLVEHLFKSIDALKEVNKEVNSIDDLPCSKNYDHIKNYIKVTNKFLINLLSSISNGIISVNSQNINTDNNNNENSNTNDNNNNNSSNDNHNNNNKIKTNKISNTLKYRKKKQKKNK